MNRRKRCSRAEVITKAEPTACSISTGGVHTGTPPCSRSRVPVAIVPGASAAASSSG